MIDYVRIGEEVSEKLSYIDIASDTPFDKDEWTRVAYEFSKRALEQLAEEIDRIIIVDSVTNALGMKIAILKMIAKEII
jgi:hypothetical protein